MRVRNVGELRDVLEDYDDDTKVRVAFQLSWPLRAYISNVVARDGGEDSLPDDRHDDREEEDVLWIAVEQVSGSGHESPYAPKELWNE